MKRRVVPSADIVHRPRAVSQLFLIFFGPKFLDWKTIRTSTMSTKVDAPQQFKQPSRKGKKAWRKNVDVTEVQEGLRLLKDEEIKGYVDLLLLSQI